MQKICKPKLERKQLRLTNYDYSQNGAYFITVCTHNRKNLFINKNAVDIINKWLYELKNKYDSITLDYYCIMPNHIHFILFKTGAHAGAPLPEIVKWYKTQTTNEYIRYVKQGLLNTFDKHIWQRNYYEHIIRGEQDLYEIRKYIQENPLKWKDDCYFNELQTNENKPNGINYP